MYFKIYMEKQSAGNTYAPLKEEYNLHGFSALNNKIYIKLNNEGSRIERATGGQVAGKRPTRVWELG